MKKMMIMVLGVLLVVNCASSTLLVKPTKAASGEATYSYSKVQHHFLAWFIPNTVSNECGEGNVVKVKVSVTPATFFLALITGGIYFPKYAEVWCG